MTETVLAKTPRALRDELEELLRDDLIGPQGGAEEELRDAPIDRYLLGLLAPRFSVSSATPSDDGEESNCQELWIWQ